LVFEAGKQIEFVKEAQDFSGGKNVTVRSRLASVI
jgi:hypothetical protein